MLQDQIRKYESEKIVNLGNKQCQRVIPSDTQSIQQNALRSAKNENP